MALPVLPNSSNFLGVALVINRNRDGPRFVFHYPPHIVPVEDRHEEEDEEGVDEDDILLERAAGPADGSSPYNLNVSDLISWNQDEHIITDDGTQIVPWEHVAGFPTKDLEGILTPARAYHKTLFQISLDPLYFVSYPIHKPEKGIWKKSKKNNDRAKKDDDRISPHDEGHDAEASAKGEETNVASDGDNVEAKENAGKPTASKPVVAQEETEDKVSSMTMFNLVFILNPKKHEAKDLMDNMYTNIIRKVNKAYKYVQQRSDFVWKESKKILLLKDRAREDKRKMSELWEEILQTSSLAASMQDLYDAISRNKIAALQLDTGEGTITHSVQIPVPFHIADLPPEDREEDSRGIWITTANSFIGDSGAFDEPHYLDKNFAMLLMDDDKKIISELSADPDETTLSMIEFVRHSKPTMSFHQVAQQTNNILTLSQVRKFAQHFIFWRRAIAIPPLHARDVYILSPNADMKTLPRASETWARQFPFAPALPTFLADLSAAPRPYKWFCPSKSFRPSYLQMLSWLMRGGWVTQLCTFAYVIVWPEILYEVEYQLEAEEVAKAKRAQVAAVDDLEHGSPDKATSVLLSIDRKRRGSKSSDMMSSSIGDLASSTTTLHQAESAAGGGGLERSIGDLSAISISDKEHPSPLAPSSPSSSFLKDSTIATPDPQSPTSPGASSNRPQSQPTLAEQVAEKARLERIADKLARELAEKATTHARKVVPRATDHPSINSAAHLADLNPHIILDAKKATGKESLYLSAIAKRFRERQTEAPPSSSKKTTETKSRTQSGALGGDGVKKTTAAAAAATTSNTTPGGKDGNKVGGAGIGTDGRAVDWDERVANTWPVFWKYFNGRSALERIALQEEMKRKDVWNLLTAMRARRKESRAPRIARVRDLKMNVFEVAAR
ncbi:Nitrogen permease regulator 3 [Cytospora mali]|uniref:Nitrogen permease regulator 3 n=1 Tax=Cytospora mali TaxID=578113 RepID=A0A194UQL1_CYTMA|nr:Nitrogen permease regulator 3 [Valsa mali var. pyri (nom. inval.)]